jgi:hypothetical protein
MVTCSSFDLCLHVVHLINILFRIVRHLSPCTICRLTKVIDREVHSEAGMLKLKEWIQLQAKL